ncbi:MAG TPA: Nramp family divalent metal transporter [Polyangiaceae bacterium]|nr:Nramp family divalent metal transporter [Polyangiaceae bacterium]
MSLAGTAGLAGTRLPTVVGRALERARRLFGLAGPAVLVSVGYIDPGNWATDLEAGARFGYRLAWVLVASSTIAVLLQTLSARLGIVSGRNLAETCHDCYSPRVNVGLWALAELGIIACDSAEVVGSAIALNLLFGVPLVLGALLTALDVLVVLALQHRRLVVLQGLVGVLLLVIAGCLGAEVALVRPEGRQLLQGFVPSLPPGAVYVAVGILGATLMPHNLYLQSALVTKSPASLRPAALRRSWISTAIALNIALLLNMAILLLAAGAFSTRGLVVDDLQEAHRLLAPVLGTSVASVLFAIALLCSGQSATITGTLAGQIVMEGFLQARLPPVLRRAATRCAALVPAVLIFASMGESGTTRLLIGSQIVLSLQLPFAIVPLLRFTASKAIMAGAASASSIRYLASACAVGVCAANGLLLWKTFADLRTTSPFTADLFALLCAVGFAFLGWVALVPLRSPAAEAPAGPGPTPALPGP